MQAHRDHYFCNVCVLRAIAGENEAPSNFRIRALLVSEKNMFNDICRCGAEATFVLRLEDGNAI